MHTTPEDHLPTINRNYKDRLFRKLFEDKSDLLVECKVTVFNINKGHNEVLLGQCHKLWEYAEFIGTINTFLAQGMPPERAVDMAVDYCIKHGILAEFLRKHRAEVKNMSILEYTLEDALANQLCEGREEGREEGLETGIRTGLLRLLEFRGFVSEPLHSRITKQTDFAILQRWFEQALKAGSASEFEHLIGVCIQKENQFL